MLPLSILDLAPVTQGSTPADSFAASVALAQQADKLGYKRYWFAEHHNMPGIASAATAVLIGHIASQTERIRVGAGGVMLPNYAPLQIAEQFGTLASLYPNRIDLGLGRAPGTDGATMRALRRYATSANTYPQDVQELLHYFEPASAEQLVRAVPGEGINVPVWLLGSSLFSAQLAATLGLPYAFASHFAPAAMTEAVALYREQFQPSAYLDKPQVMLALNIIVADSDQEARHLFTTQQQAFVNLRRGQLGKVPPPIDDIESYWSPQEKLMVNNALACSLVGSDASVKTQLEQFIRQHQPDELIVTAQIYDVAKRIESFTRLAKLATINA